MNVVPQMGEDHIETLAVDRVVSVQLAKLVAMVDDATYLQWEPVQPAPRLGLIRQVRQEE
jgi:hypothetical protein